MNFCPLHLSDSEKICDGESLDTDYVESVWGGRGIHVEGLTEAWPAFYALMQHAVILIPVTH